MDYERFKEGFQDALKAELAVRGADVELTARRVDKMNDSYDAITVRPVDSSIGVNISVEKAFAAYENGTPIPEIAEHFADAVEKGFRESPQVDLESLSDYEQMKNKLSMEVVSAEKNAELLESVPHERMEDMAVVYRFVLDQTDSGNGTILVTNQLLEQYGITKEQLRADAMENAPEITDAEKFEKSIAIPHQNDGFNEVRDEYTGMLKRQMEAGNNGLTKTKYLSFGIHAESMKAAKPRLIHIEMDLLNNFKRLGVQANTLNGAERLELIHQQFHMGDDEKFFFDWKWLVGSGLSVKDFVAPAGLNFKNGRLFQMGNLYGAMSFLSITASDISDRMLADFLGMESSQIVTMHVQSVDQTEAIKTVKHTITELDRSKIEEQKKAVRAGYDMDIIPSDLATYGKDAKALLKELQSQNERMFLLTFLVLNTGKTEQELENNVFQANSIAQKHNCNLVRLNFQQEQGLMSSLPLAYNEIERVIMQLS